jgi:hypothetical protein
MQQRRLASVVETEEQKLGVLVQQAQVREHIVDCTPGPSKARVSSPVSPPEPFEPRASFPVATQGPQGVKTYTS